MTHQTSAMLRFEQLRQIVALSSLAHIPFPADLPTHLQAEYTALAGKADEQFRAVFKQYTGHAIGDVVTVPWMGVGGAPARIDGVIFTDASPWVRLHVLKPDGSPSRRVETCLLYACGKLKKHRFTTPTDKTDLDDQVADLVPAP